MKILLVSEYFPKGRDLLFSGGVETRTFFVAKNLAKRHDVTVLCSYQKGTKRQEKMFGFTIDRVGSKRDYQASVGDIFKRVVFIISAINFGRKLDCEIVEGSNFITHFVTWVIGFWKKIPTVAWYPDVWVGHWLKNVGFFGFFGEILERSNLVLGFDRYIAISKVVSKKLEKNGISKKKIEIVPCGVESSEFLKKVKKFNHTTIVCMTRLVSYKRVEDLVLAFSLLIKKIKNLRLMIIGSGPQEKELKNLTRKYRLSKKVIFKKNLPRKNLIRFLESSHLFCLPSQTEGFGIAVIEAAASRIPYVVSDIDALKEITKNGQGGFLFKVGDTKDLSEKMEKLLIDKNLYQKKSKEGILLSKNYQWSKIAQETERVYLNLLKN